MLVCTTICAQDTLCVMVCLDEVIHFNYSTSKIEYRYDHEGELQLKVNNGEVMCLHFCDEKKRFRDVTTTFSNGEHIHNTFDSKDNVVYTKDTWGDLTIEISDARRRRQLLLLLIAKHYLALDLKIYRGYDYLIGLKLMLCKDFLLLL